jgi:hypothetical protein
LRKQKDPQGEIVMSYRLLSRLFTTDRDSWSADKWRRHLLSKADLQSERDDIIAMFVD